MDGTRWGVTRVNEKQEVEEAGRGGEVCCCAPFSCPDPASSISKVSHVNVSLTRHYQDTNNRNNRFNSATQPLARCDKQCLSDIAWINMRSRDLQYRARRPGTCGADACVGVKKNELAEEPWAKGRSTNNAVGATKH